MHKRAKNPSLDLILSGQFASDWEPRYQSLTLVHRVNTVVTLGRAAVHPWTKGHANATN